MKPTCPISTIIYTKEDEKLEKAIANEIEIPDPELKQAEATLNNNTIEEDEKQGENS